MIIEYERTDTALTDLLETLVDLGGSDLHVSGDAFPMIRAHGRLRPVPGRPRLTKERAREVIYDLLTEAQRKRFEDSRELDFSFGIAGLSRFRGNIHYERDSVGAVYRAIPSEVRSFDDLGLPAAVANFCELPRGLVLVTGPTGSGKSTTLAAMLDKINREREGHIVTIEDPIEYIHHNKKCKVIQREVGSDTDGFAGALRTVLRQDPDVVLIGEMRDLETIESALRVAETGHLTLATLHTNSAASTINRIIDVFPANQQPQIRSQLSLVLEGIICQGLLPSADEAGRVMALEVLIPDPAIKNLIRENKIHQIPSAMSISTGKTGMQTYNQSLVDLYSRRQITHDTAMRASSDKEELSNLIRRSEKDGFATPGGGAAFPHREFAPRVRG